jgi:hypothetical protein
MKKNRPLLVVLGILFFISGSAINLLFSSNLVWGEMEALLFFSQTGARNLQIDCPLVIADWEESSITSIVTNDSNQATKPQVNAMFSYQKDIRVETETLNLEAFASQPLKWIANADNLIFERLILVNVFQHQYRTLEARQGTCSILVYSLFGMNGRNTVIALVEIGVLASLLGIGLLYYGLHPFVEIIKKLMQVNIIFPILVLLGLFSALPRLWGFTLFFNAMAVLAISVAYIEILLGKK